MDIAVVDCGSSKLERIRETLRRAGAGVRVARLAEATAADLDAADGVVISGGPHLFTGPGGDDLRRSFDLLGGVSSPLLGICLGHQAMGLLHGVEVYRGPERRGPERIEIVARHPLVEGLAAAETFTADHVEGIPLPSGFVRLGSSRHYQVEIMAATDRPWFGVQFHPEVSGDAGARLMANFLTIVGAWTRR